MKQINFYTLCALAFLQVKYSTGCNDAFKSVEATVEFVKETQAQKVIINGCIERLQPSFRNKTAETITIEGQNVGEITRDSVRHMVRLKVLRIKDSGVKSIHPESFRNLVRIKEISITGNDIQEIKGFAIYMPLDVLILSGNNIGAVKGSGFGNMPTLTRLQLDHNQISEFDKDWLYNTSKLELLDLGHNRIKEIKEDSFIYIKNVSEIHLEFNELKTIPNFGALQNLKYLNLRNNKIKTVNSDSFRKQKINNLFLSGNILNYLPKSLFANLQVANLTLLGNPITCTCFDSVNNWLKATGGSLQKPEDRKKEFIPVCVYPKVLSATCVESIDEEITDDYKARVETFVDHCNATCFNLK